MANDRFPLLRGQTVSSPFKAVIGGPRPASPPRPDPAAHRPKLLAQLDAIVGGAQSRPAGQRDPDASREIIAVRPSDPADPLKPEQLADAKHDVRVVNVDAESGVVLLDAPGPNLEKLRQKAKEYGQPQHKKREDGTVATSRKHEAALGPVNEIALATEPDLVGPRLREWAAQGTMPAADINLWLELACRGGYRNPREWTTKSRDQVCRQVYPITQSIPQQYMSSSQQQDHEGHGNSEVTITVDDHQWSIHRGNRPVAEIKEVAGVPQTHVLEAIINGTLTPLDDAAAVVLKGGERFISHLRDSASS